MSQDSPTLGEQTGFWRHPAPTPVAKVWRLLYSMTDGLTPEDARFSAVMAALDACDAAGQDLARLRQAAAKVKAAVLA